MPTLFLDAQYALLYDAVENGGRAVYDDSKEAWTIPSLETPGHLSVRGRRPCINGRHNPDFFVDLDIEMPTRTTPDPDHPNTPQLISSILSMDLNDDMEEIPRREKKRQDKLLRIDDVSAIPIFVVYNMHLSMTYKIIPVTHAEAKTEG